MAEGILFIFGTLLALIGLFMLSTATAGVGLLTAGCFLAIFARIAQASHHHKELMQRFGAMQE